MTGTELRAAAGQLIIMGFTGAEMTPALRVVLRAIQPGGVILFARNITGARSTWELLRECRAAIAEPMFLCVDLEGGTVDRLRDVVAHAPAAAEVFATGSRRLFRRHGRIIGDEVRALGFNTDFAPVFDLAFPASASVLASRVVSADPALTVLYAREFLRGLAAARVLGCGKHFPGLGEAALDTHHELPAVRKSLAAMWDEDLAPYRALRRELPFVMVAHANYPEVTRDPLPASLSAKWMTDILRKKIGYGGIILADDLEMGGVLAAAGIGDAAIATLRAGADMFLVCHSEEQVWRTYEAVLRAAERDRRFAQLVGERARRVRAAKKRRPELRGHAPAPNARSVGKLRDAVLRFREEVHQNVSSF